MAQEKLQSVEDRPLGIYRRPDVEAKESHFQGEASWILKDPFALKYHRLQEPEMLVWQSLDEATSLRDLGDILQVRYPTKKTRPQDIQRLLFSLHRSGLVVSDKPEQGMQLLHQDRVARRQRRNQRFTSLLSIRLPGIDPEPLLRRLYPKTAWLFSKWFFAIWLGMLLAAGTLLLVNANEVQQRLPEFGQFFSLRNFIWLALITSVTKIVHELGHGLACKHYGGECHEIGAMLLVFTPTLYCDTSDSWILPNKWHRAFIGAAGMYVEVLLASIATFSWWYTQPGLIHYASLNVLFVCSLSTVVFNANPLLRYDGYYMLSDLMEIPNLAAKSRLAILNLSRVVFLGMKPVSRRQLPERGLLWFALYSIASFFYRWFILFIIMWFMYKIFEPRGLQAVGYTIIATSAVGLLVMPIWKMIQFFVIPGRVRQVKAGRLIGSLVLLSALVAFLSYFPVQSHVYCPTVIRAKDGENVYVAQRGTIKQINRTYGEPITPGEAIAELENKELQLEIIRLSSELSRQTNRLASLRIQQGRDPVAGAEIPQTEAAIQDLASQLEQLREDVQALELRSSIAGILMPPSERAPEDLLEKSQALTWQRLPLAPANQGATLDVATLVGTVATPGQMKAILLIEQQDVGLVSIGESVQIVLDEAPDTRLAGVVKDIGKSAVRDVPSELTVASGGVIATEPSAAGGQQPTGIYYEAAVELSESPFELMPGFRGQAKIGIQPESIATKLGRLLRNLVHFR